MVPEFGKIDNNKSVLSNFKILDQNWENLKKYLTKLEEEIGSISQEIDLETLIQSVLENINSKKIKFELNPNINESTPSVNGVDYILTKISNDTMQISRTNGVWDLSQALFQCKVKLTGEVVYPNIQVISENNNYKLNITFNNWQNEIYDLVIM